MSIKIDDGSLIVPQGGGVVINGADANNVNVGTASAFYAVQITSPFSHGVTGIQGGAADRVLIGQWSKSSMDANGAAFEHESSSSAAANQILLPDNSRLLASELGCFLAIYDAVEQRWKAM